MSDADASARAAARRTLQALRIEAISEIDIEAIANFHRVFVVEGEDGLHGAEGRSLLHNGAGIIRIGAGITQLGRRRFIIAHELGHCLIHKTGTVKACETSDLFRYEDGNLETEANWFASELLMPKALFTPYCDVRRPTFEAINAIASKCLTTLTATSIRFVQCSPERCAVVWSESGKVKWSVSSSDFPERIEPNRPLHRLSHASDAFKNPLPKGLQPVPSHAWLNRRVPGGNEVHEETLEIKKLQAALTLLWIPPNVHDEDNDEDDDDPRWRR